MLNAERWRTETPLSHLPHGKMSITLYDVSCLLHLPIRGKLLDNGNINRDDAFKLVVDYLGVNLESAMKEFEATRWAHARFRFLDKVYTNELHRA